MTKLSTGLAALAATALLAGTAQAQTVPTSPFSVEVRGNVLFPTGDFAEEGETGEKVETGFGARVGGLFRINPLLGIYAGYSYNQFGTDLGEEAEEADVSIDVLDTGFDAGLQASFGTPGGVQPYVRGGLVFHRVAFDLSDELEEFFEEELGVSEDDLKSDYTLGFDLGGGVSVPLGPRLSAIGELGYTQYEVDDEDQEGGEIITTQAKISYVRGSIGLSLRF